MTTDHKEFQFSADIRALGNQQTGEGWHMELGWKLPGSKYHLNLYGQDWDQVQGLAIGQRREWRITRGTLKNNREGQYLSDYFWDWDGPTDNGPPDNAVRTMERPAPVTPTPQAPVGVVVVEGIIKGHVEKLALDLYLREYEVDAGIDWMRLREIRDGIYHEFKEKPIHTPHWCYRHDVSHQRGNTGYGHRVPEENAWCVEGVRELMYDTPSETGPGEEE